MDITRIKQAVQEIFPIIEEHNLKISELLDIIYMESVQKRRAVNMEEMKFEELTEIERTGEAFRISDAVSEADHAVSVCTAGS